MESTKMLIDKSEYDDLCRKEIRLEMIQRGMENYLKIFNSSDAVYLENDFLVILRNILRTSNWLPLTPLDIHDDFVRLQLLLMRSE